MPAFEEFTYSRHSRQRMLQRRISDLTVGLVLQLGESDYDELAETWTFVLDDVAVVIVERGEIAHVVTVYRVRKHT